MSLRGEPVSIPPVDVAIVGIGVAYNETVPVKDLSLDVYKGEFLSLLGPSGCGKTTTLRAIAGFVAPFEGDIRIAGQSVLEVPPNHRNIGMVYQDFALFPHMTVAENVAFGMKMRKVPGAEIALRVPKILALLKLGAFGERYPNQLSGGQQQRVALARALVINPSVLLLDEPLASLDRQLRADMQFELRQLQREVGITTVFVTHDQEEALSLSDRIAVMNAGKILQVDTPRAIYDHPAHRFVAEFIGVANFMPATVTRPAEADAGIELAGIPGTQRIPGRHAAGTVEIMLRPEKVTLESADARSNDALNRLSGRVANSVFVGTTIKYQVQLDSGAMLRVDVAAGAAAVAPIGAAVTLGWSPQDARVFRDGVAEP